MHTLYSVHRDFVWNPMHNICVQIKKSLALAAIPFRVRTEKSFQNSQTFHKPLQYGAKKQHKGMQLCRTSGKGAQPLL